MNLLSLLIMLAQVPFINRFELSGNGLGVGVVAYYKMDEASGNAIDSSPNLLNLTESGTAASAAGMILTSRQIDTTNYFSHTDNALFEPTTNDFSIIFWAYITEIPLVDTTQLLVSKWHFAGLGSYQINTFNAGGTNGFEFYVMQSDLVIPLNWPQLQIELTTNVWWCIAARISASSGLFYLDVRRAGIPWESDFEPYDSTINNSDAPLVINGSLNAGMRVADGEMSAGTRIDELAFYNRFLSDCEIESYFNSAMGLPFASYTTTPCVEGSSGLPIGTEWSLEANAPSWSLEAGATEFSQD